MMRMLALAAVLTKSAGRWRGWYAGLPQALVISLGLAPADAEYAGRLRAAQIAAIVRLTPLTMGASCLNAAILLLTLWRMDDLLGPGVWIWCSLVFAAAVYYGRNWLLRRRRDEAPQASANTIRKAIIHGALFGALWGAVPVLIFAGAPSPAQLLVGCLTAGMMCAGGFALATVPLAGMSYVLLVATGAFLALLQQSAAVYVGLAALMFVYTAVIIVGLNWNAYLFVGHFLAEAQVRREIAAREQAQSQAAHADRMIALGELAGGIAHDVNNVLQAIGGQAELIERRCAEPAEIRRLARIVLEAVERGGAVSRRLLSFARRDTLMAEPVDIAAILKALCELLHHSLAPATVLHVQVEPEAGAALADKTQLETALLNLATNARDAIRDGGIITLSASREAIAQDATDLPLEAGSYVRVDVADSGRGMDPATLRRAVEPFFTTKPRGKGTGLGLSMAQGFAEQSGAALSIRSELGRGTIVSIWLPRADIAPAPRLERSTSSAPASSDYDGRPNVLVVDDDELVREVVMLSLAEAGFATAGAEDGGSALAYLDQGRAVDALITDFSMPGMNGLDLIREAHLRRPTLPAILLTGHVGDMAAPFGHSSGDRVTVLQKPVRGAELAQRLAACMATTTALQSALGV